MRRLCIITLAVIIFLFPPYYEQGLFTSEWGWMFLADAFPPFALDIWWIVWIVEFGLLAIVNLVWKRSESPQQVAVVGNRQIHHSESRQDQASALDELEKLSALRQSGALTEEEFTAQKARLMADGASSGTQAAASPPTGAVRGEAGDRPGGYPTSRIKAAVDAGKAGGVSSFFNESPLHRLLWKFDQPVPPQPYLDADRRMLAIYACAGGVLFGLIMTVLFSILFGGTGLGTFLIMAIVFGGSTFIFAPIQAKGFRTKLNLPEWNELTN